MYLLESFHIFVFVLDTVFVKLINFSRTANVPSNTSKPFGGKSEQMRKRILLGVNPLVKLWSDSQTVRQSRDSRSDLRTNQLQPNRNLERDFCLLSSIQLCYNFVNASDFRSGLGVLSAICNPTPANRHE